ncbi:MULTISPECIES: indole-3-glycerol phosphate synthase TrpC [Shouchella]|jgi:indole-3-glycerol phosphate synthase|uniref:indole-3-glycerol phosphate synthase TrpC n=1 Tax=Shouchella TaxID=2893057 RepID=UPI000792A8B8|nr:MULTISPECIES: indole-3-glycerol phosphate synthase TrpC [Shouchella]KKI85743.1 indole-3-glycerol phosphate synthase [Shouchella clausii]MBX0318593.1 indole-3-glycerol phosphate synthase TrpC [Shouchella clausii]MDO7268296.1 indole-3-glycerol phosphate synthase TrpC [Shouchella clausii]MDO7283150.1 indole-3-glycerol phosphate synthase TrpC [Shouchella clausii]MDO7288176.1 indole-3-glycerol phosphate synthase TrpC [Shouchella clausii]
MLEKILATKREEISQLQLPEKQYFPKKSLKASLQKTSLPLGLIAEIKQASPSKGVLCEAISPTAIARVYEEGGASAISVLTDRTYFQGDTAYVAEVKKTVSLPVLRKDFILSPLQVEETACIGADAMLLIAGAMEAKQLHELYELAYSKGLECLVEVHSEEELESLLAVFTPEVIGINNRNLKTFQTSVSQTEQIAKMVPKEALLVSESGIHTPDDIARVKKAGANAVLIGEQLMRKDDKRQAIIDLFSESAINQ